jgi:UDP-3-O-[3-hydroxymyristoyl] N-acetylglucosamine deacetylase
MTSIEGHGLHGGARSRLHFLPEPGPVRLRSAGHEALLGELVLDGASRSTTVSTPDGRLRIRTVEHLFAALAALGIRDGVVIELEGPEIPLVDGGARAFMNLLASLQLVPAAPALRVVRGGVVEVESSRYELRPGSGVEVEVEVDFDDVRLASHARWTGDPADFRERIASARTFGFAHEVEALLARGLASHVAPESVVVIAQDHILSAGQPFNADEPARHKLLDLVGDLYAHGGPPLGVVRAVRPGHGATHEAMRRAVEQGLLVRSTT